MSVLSGQAPPDRFPAPVLAFRNASTWVSMSGVRRRSQPWAEPSTLMTFPLSLAAPASMSSWAVPGLMELPSPVPTTSSIGAVMRAAAFVDEVTSVRAVPLALNSAENTDNPTTPET